MTNIRFEVPRFLPEKCTGCSQCWIQCPDSAIPGLVSTAADLWETAIGGASSRRSVSRIRSISKHLAQESHKLVSAVPFTSFGEVATAAYRNVVDRLGWDAKRRAELDEEFAAVHPSLRVPGGPDRPVLRYARVATGRLRGLPRSRSIPRRARAATSASTCPEDAS
jgi:pyruvate-ferredoxin/flavodoxin oxidoreductase